MLDTYYRFILHTGYKVLFHKKKKKKKLNLIKNFLLIPKYLFTGK